MDTVLVKLSSANKQSLLYGASQRVIQRQGGTEIVLKRLHQLNSELAAQFQLKQDALADLTLRMICSTDADIVHDSNANVPAYFAVSYCWHNSSWKAVEAAQPLTKWGVSQPMANKILSLRNSKDEGVWVDRICINQDDETEKKIAIGSMDVIYRACRRLLILLEDVQLNQTEESVGLKYATLYENMCLAVRLLSDAEKSSFINWYWHLDASDVPAVMEFAMKMLGARWYSRAWCAHEIRVNEHSKINNPLFLCFGANGGVLSFEFRFVHFLAYHLHQPSANAVHKDIPYGMDVSAALGDTSCTTLFQRMVRINRLLPGHDPRISLLDHLSTISSFGCQELPDLCAIAMNTAEIPLVFKGTVQSLENISYISSLIVLASGDVSPLLLQATKLQMLDSSGKKFISWADQPYKGPHEMRVETPFPLSISSATAKYIELDILLVKGRPMKVADEFMEMAHSILEKHALRGNGNMFGVEDLSFTEPLVKTAIDFMNASVNFNWYQVLLGSALECGIDWMMRLPNVLEKETNSGEWDHGKFNGFDSSFADAAADLLSYFGITKENSARFDDQFLRPMIRFLTCITDDRLRFLAFIPRRIQTRADGDFAITNQISNRSWIAIPQAVSHLPLFHNRAWVVEPYDPAAPEKEIPPFLKTRPPPTDLEAWADTVPALPADFPDRRDRPNDLQSWRMRKRQPLFGCQPVIEDGEAVILLKKQKVYGGDDYDWEALGKMLGRRQ
ncbi:hypothetical protein K432DRAFT_386457 [Lepidopterella palustris CBS 459.81]|uniref:Heterokaryon incompatibility domain-containing protein n=1 Tax=Lepidopterella palustris CBS 459.81 TaxID=1314670 RepID=A0A8E2E0I7_9PEZI|nr:hypothetical protein K432DRAFT_386457 [Lepidopterella palustris CBS 459.81]